MSISKSSSFKQLVTFHKVARLSSVSQAAKELFISQAAVSIQLANLEEATGTKLINRTGRGIRLTPAGEKLFQMSSRISSVPTFFRGGRAVEAQFLNFCMGRVV